MATLSDIDRIAISNFRSIKGNIVVPLDAPIVLLHGPNGTGKTSVLSAIELALTGNIAALSDEEPDFRKYLVNTEATSKTSGVTLGAGKAKLAAGSYTINGGMKGLPFLNEQDGAFFSERCYLAQSTLTRLLQIYQKADANTESALTHFVKDLLGLGKLDALIDGLHDAGDKRRWRNLVPELRGAEATVTELDALETTSDDELERLQLERSSTIQNLRTGYKTATGQDLDVTFRAADVLTSLRALTVDQQERDNNRRQVELSSLADAWAALPTDVTSERRTAAQQTLEAAARSADAWRASAGVELNSITTALQAVFPDLASWQSTEPASAHATMITRARNELERQKQQLDQDMAQEKRQREIDGELEREKARLKLIDDQASQLSGQAGDLARSLAGVVPHIHGQDCPVCGRNYDETKNGPLLAHVQRTIAALTAEAGRLSALSTERAAASRRLSQLTKDRADIVAHRLTAEAKLEMSRAIAMLTQNVVALERIAEPAVRGKQLLANEQAARTALAAFREGDRLASDLLETLGRLRSGVLPEVKDERAFDEQVLNLRAELDRREAAIAQVQTARLTAMEQCRTLLDVDTRVIAAQKRLDRTQHNQKIWKQALDRVETVRTQAKSIAQAALEARTEIVRKVFNTSLNKLWRDLFIRLAPTEPFVPAFHVPETAGKVVAQLETIHRSGLTAGSPGSMLSAGNLNTAALTLFLALHFSVAARLPWLVLDDPVQNMDELHIAQFAALLRTISKVHQRKVIIAVHERSLFEYLALELAPAFEKDSLLTVELRRSLEGTTVDPQYRPYERDTLAA